MNVIRQLVADARVDLHRKADKVRILAWAEQVEWQRLGLPAKGIERQTMFPLAWANLLDALAGDFDLPGCGCARHRGGGSA